MASGASQFPQAASGAVRDGAIGGLGRDVLVALRRIIRATDLHSRQTLKLCGLTVPQLIVLQAVDNLGEVTTGAVSGRVSLSQATVTTILDRLERRGLVERYRSETDRRVVHSQLTQAGRAVLRDAPPLLHERFIAEFARLGPRKQRQIVDVLEQVAEMLGADTLDAAPVLASGAPDASGPD